MADATIPQPSEAELHTNLQRWHQHARTDGDNDTAGLIRRCYAAEADNARLRAEVEQTTKQLDIYTESAESLLADARKDKARHAAIYDACLKDRQDLSQRIAALEASLATARADMQDRCAKVADEWVKHCRSARVVPGDLARNYFGGGLEASEKIAAAIRALPPTEPTS